MARTVIVLNVEPKQHNTTHNTGVRPAGATRDAQPGGETSPFGAGAVGRLATAADPARTSARLRRRAGTRRRPAQQRCRRAVPAALAALAPAVAAGHRPAEARS